MVKFYICSNCGYPMLDHKCPNCKELSTLDTDFAFTEVIDEYIERELRLVDEKVSKWKFRGAEKVIITCLERQPNDLLLLYYYGILALETSIEKDENIVWVDSIDSALKRLTLFFSNAKSSSELYVGANGLITVLRYFRSDLYRHDIDEDAFGDIDKKLARLNPVFKDGSLLRKL